MLNNLVDRLAAAPELGGDYPTSWGGFIGQDLAKRQLQLAAKSAKTRKAPLDHALIASGVPGVGKTAMALLTARSMNRQVRVASGKLTFGQARLVLTSMRDRDVLFIDEIHRMVQGGKKDAEWLLHYLQDGVLMGPMGPEPVPQVTVIAATTDAGRLPETIVSRFALRPTIVEYTTEEGAAIVKVMAKRVLTDLPAPSSKNCAALAEAANNNPRAIRRLLTTLRDLAVTGESTAGKAGYDLAGLLEWHGLTADGLDRAAQQYLLALLLDFTDGAGERALMDRLQEPGGLATVEHLLMAKGLIGKTKKGRVLTQHGMRRARDLIQQEAA